MRMKGREGKVSAQMKTLFLVKFHGREERRKGRVLVQVFAIRQDNHVDPITGRSIGENGTGRGGRQILSFIPRIGGPSRG